MGKIGGYDAQRGTRTKKEGLTSSAGRTRSYACVLYPESAPENWRDILSDFHIPCLISPLHDKDVNPTGEKKKAHYHVLLLFDSVKSETQAREIFEAFGGVGCEKVNSVRGYARYLCHLDNPEKFQYPMQEVTELFGADYQALIPNNSDRYGMIKDMRFFIKTHNMTYFNQFFDYCADNNDDWFRCLCDSSAYIIKEYMKSMAFEENATF